MRTETELASEEFEDDMSELKAELEKRGIEHTFGKHILTELEPGVFDLMGYWPSGEWHIRIGDVSVIRGMVSFGYYEAYGGKFKDPERFKTPEELIQALDLPAGGGGD